jgi:hypothetical protein
MLQKIVAMAIYFGFILAPVWLLSLVWILRRSHARHIYLIWYVFSFFFVLFLSLNVVAGHNQQHIEDIFGSSAKAYFMTLYDLLTDGEGEIKMVLGIVGLVVLPQFLTYILSGVTGSASPPLLVSHSMDFAIWSLAKFSAALSAIVLADWAVKVDWQQWRNFDIITSLSLFLAIWLLVLSFLLVWMHHVIGRGIGFVLSLKAFSVFLLFHEFCTRFSRTPDDPEASAPDSVATALRQILSALRGLYAALRDLRNATDKLETYVASFSKKIRIFRIPDHERRKPE